MTIASQLSNRFEEKLQGPLGSTPVAFAIRHCLELILELRDGGASWEQILHQINAVLENAHRTAISADTLRGMVARERRTATNKKSLRQPAEITAMARSATTTASFSPAEPSAKGGNLMNGESKLSAGSSLEQAADMAAALEQMKGI